LSTTEPAGEIASGTQCGKFTENSQGWSKTFGEHILPLPFALGILWDSGS
jgi:hypothetical protein